MKDNDKPVTTAEIAEYAVNSIAEFCLKLQKEGVPGALILLALDINHGMCLKMTIDASLTAFKAEQSNPSEGSKGG